MRFGSSILKRIDEASTPKEQNKVLREWIGGLSENEDQLMINGKRYDVVSCYSGFGLPFVDVTRPELVQSAFEPDLLSIGTTSDDDASLVMLEPNHPRGDTWNAVDDIDQVEPNAELYKTAKAR